jgi:hypothetical protein
MDFYSILAMMVATSFVTGLSLAPTTTTLLTSQSTTSLFETTASDSLGPVPSSATNQGCGINGFAQVHFFFHEPIR